MKQQIVDRITKVEGAPTLTQIYRGLGGDKNLKEQVRNYVQTGNKTISKLIWPIEDAIHDFAVAMLENMESAYVLDNAKELDRLKKEVQTAIKSIQAYQGEGQEMAHEILAKQLRKIKHLDNITSVAEGFVFEYDGQLYKFTGNFAPINQILGLFRFGRRGVKIPRVDESRGVSETVAIVPGAFKPPHRGHLDMVRHYADNADRVIVMVSPKSRQCPSGRDVTQDESIAIWELYLQNLGLSNIEVMPSPHPSPVRSAYDYVGEIAEPGEMVILGTSTKGGDQSRFAKNVQQYAKEGVRVLDPMKYAFDPIGEELSACDFRAALESGELATAKFLPNGVSPEDVLEILGIKSGTEEVVEHVTLPIFFRLIEQALDEVEPYQKKAIAKHKRNRLTTKGKVVKSAPFSENPPEERGKSAPPLGEDNEDEIEEISSMAGGSVEGYALPLGAKPKKKKKRINKPYMEPHMHQDEGKDPKKGTGKKPKGSGRRLYTDEDPSDTVSVKFSTVQDIKDTLSKASFKSKSHKRQSQIINLIHQRARAAYNNAKDPKVKKRLKRAYDYAKTRKEASKRKTQRMNKSK
jgi:cytidyltransferase-like protein